MEMREACSTSNSEVIGSMLLVYSIFKRRKIYSQ